jgi:hypothetical protein
MHQDGTTPIKEIEHRRKRLQIMMMTNPEQLCYLTLKRMLKS